MKSSIRRFRNQTKPPIPLAANQKRGLVFNLGGGTADRETYLRTYGQSGTVYSIVSLLAGSAASPEWHLYRKQPVDARRRYTTATGEDDQRVEIVNHAARSLLLSPNDFHDRFAYFEGSNQHEELTGETFWVLNREGTTFPTSMWYVRPDRMEPVPSVDDYLLGYIYTGPNGEQVPLQLDEVILEKLPDPLDPYRGAGPVASILPNIDQMKYATQYQRNLFINGADPGGIITLPNKLTEPEWDEFTDRWRESHQGVARAGRVGVLENGAQWVGRGATNKDLEYGNLRLANREELREAWRIHAHMLGITEDVNRANAEAAKETFDSDLLIPRLNRRRSTLNNKLLPMFGATGQGVEFDYDNPVKSEQEQDIDELQGKANAAKTLIDAGFDPHDVLEAVGLPDMEVLEQASPIPAVPPGWVVPSGGGSDAGAEDDPAALANLLRRELRPYTARVLTHSSLNRGR